MRQWLGASGVTASPRRSRQLTGSTALEALGWPAGYVLIYYVLPISARNPIYAHKLSLVGFWSLVALAGSLWPGAPGILVFFACEVAALIAAAATRLRY